MSERPCKNPHCKSFGIPHPNCKCFGDNMASGGLVEDYCSKDRRHGPNCEYFAAGGEVGVPTPDANAAVSGFLAHQGLHGLLKMNSNKDLPAYEKSSSRGHKMIDQSIESLFSREKHPQMDTSRAKEAIEDWMSKGGINHDVQQEIYKQNAMPQMLAEGGEVKDQAEGILHNHPIAQAYPEQNILLQSAKGRASQYLNGLRTQGHIPKLAFDEAPDQKVRQKAYDRALESAAHPLGIVDKIGKGTIEPEHMTHFNSMYPELNDHLQKKITERIVQAQLKGEKPDRVTRQGLSLFMKTPLSSELTPQNMAAIQSTFQVMQAANSASSSQHAPQKQRAGTKSALSKSDQAFLTGSQALAERSQKQ